MDERRVAVVGAGAVGTTAAHDLADRGRAVTLYEAETVAAGASGRAAGICYDAFAEDIDAAVADRALSRFHTLDADPSFDWSFTPRPYVWLARDGDARRAAAIREQVPRMQAHGRRVELLDGDDLAAEFPALRADTAVAAVARDAGSADPGAYTDAMAERAVATGVTLREETPVELRAGDEHPHVVTADGSTTYETVVVAAGAHTARLLGDAGLPIPVKPYRVQAAITESTPLVERAPQLYDATGGYYCRPRGDGLLVGDGTEPVERDPDDWDRDADDWFRADCIEHLRAAFGGSTADGDNAAVPELDRAWAGLCTATPDGNPLLGERAPGVVVATGWQGHGFMRAPALGERVARGVCDGEWLDPFDPARFDGDESFDIVEGMVVEES
jgi:sarcosine oxidase subunit beta